MVRSARRLALSVGGALACLCLAAVPTAWAAPPANDGQDQATVVAALPFTDTLDTTEATLGPEDEAARLTCEIPIAYPKSVWYRYTPATDQDIAIDTTGSSYEVGVGVGTGASCVAVFPESGTFSAQAGKTYFIAFVDMGVAGAGGSLEVSIAVNHAPACDGDLAVSVQAGTSVQVPFPNCADPDGDLFDVFVVDEPSHGVYDYATGRYSPSAGYVGQDTLTFQAIDDWGAESDLGVIRITVTPAPRAQSGPQPTPQRQPPDVTAPTLDLLTSSSMSLRTALRGGIRFTAATDEAGRLVVRVFVDRRTARRLGIKKNATRRVVVGSLTRDITTGETVVRVKLSRKARSRLKRAARVKLQIVVRITDSSGNVGTNTFRITLQRKRSG